MKNKKLSLNGLFKNNKFLIVLSLVISLVIWVCVNMSGESDTTLTINDIPIQMELPDELNDNGMQIFADSTQTATVTVSGSRSVLGSISAKDITVTAATNGVDSAGNYQLSLSAVKATPSASFQIISTVTPSSLNVLVDYLREDTFQIQENVVYKVADNYYAAASLGQKEIVISGPQTEIAKIAKVSATAELDSTLTESAEMTADIVLYDKSGNKLSTDLLTMEFTTVPVTVSVLPEKTVDVVPEFINKPDNLQLTDSMLSVEPSSVNLAGPQEILDKTDSVSLASIDFSTLSNERYEYDSQGINIPTDCKNISNSTTAKLVLDLSSLSKKSFSVSTFTVKGLDSSYKASVTQDKMTVTVIGSQDELDELKATDITGVIDMSEQSGTLGSVQMPVTFSISGTKTCWVSGTYKANITVSENSQ